MDRATILDTGKNTEEKRLHAVHRRWDESEAAGGWIGMEAGGLKGSSARAVGGVEVAQAGRPGWRRPG
jgi:hypothetical protein